MNLLLRCALPLSLAVAGCAAKTPEPLPPIAGDATPVVGSAGPRPAAPGQAQGDITEAEAAVTAGDADRAARAAKAALAKEPKNPKALYYAGVAAQMQGDKAAAEQSFRDALAQAPTFADAAVNLSALLVDSNRARDAVALLDPMAAKAPDDPLLQEYLASALSASGDHARAATYYGRLAARPDATPQARLGYAGELIAAGKKDEAAKVLREGVAGASGNRDLYAAFGAALGKAGAFDDAIKALDQALKIKSSADLLTYRALFRRSLKDLPAARADLEEAIKTDPKFGPAYVYLGEVFEGMNKPADAKKAYEQALAAADPRVTKRAQDHLDAMKPKK